jgi:hypothetical protein
LLWEPDTLQVARSWAENTARQSCTPKFFLEQLCRRMVAQTSVGMSRLLTSWAEPSGGSPFFATFLGASATGEGESGLQRRGISSAVESLLSVSHSSGRNVFGWQCFGVECSCVAYKKYGATWYWDKYWCYMYMGATHMTWQFVFKVFLPGLHVIHLGC